MQFYGSSIVRTLSHSRLTPHPPCFVLFQCFETMRCEWGGKRQGKVARIFLFLEPKNKGINHNRSNCGIRSLLNKFDLSAYLCYALTNEKHNTNQNNYKSAKIIFFFFLITQHLAHQTDYSGRPIPPSTSGGSGKVPYELVPRNCLHLVDFEGSTPQAQVLTTRPTPWGQSAKILVFYF